MGLIKMLLIEKGLIEMVLIKTELMKMDSKEIKK